MARHEPRMVQQDYVSELLDLDLEYRLTIAHRIECWCSRYFAERREILIPQILRKAREEEKDTVDYFAAFARKVHETKCPTMPQPGTIFDQMRDALLPAIEELRDEFKQKE